MNRTKIQYAVIAQQQVAEALQKASDWSQQLDLRLNGLTEEETVEFNKRVAGLIDHLARNGPAPAGNA